MTPETYPAVIFDWSHDHKMTRSRPCRYCEGPTDLKDDANRAAHKLCAERAAEAKGQARRRTATGRLLEVAS